MGLGLTFLVVGSVFVGVLGAWRLATLFPSNRSRMAVLAVYAAVPLAARGHLHRAAHGARRVRRDPVVRPPPAVAPSASAPPTRRPSDDLVDGIIGLGRRERLRRTAARRPRRRGRGCPGTGRARRVRDGRDRARRCRAGGGQRPAHGGLDGRARSRRVRRGVAAQPAVVADVVVGRHVVARARRPARAWRRRRRLDGHRAGSLRGGRAGAVRAGARRPRRRPVVAPDVGGASGRARRRVPRPRRPAGP